MHNASTFAGKKYRDRNHIASAYDRFAEQEEYRSKKGMHRIEAGLIEYLLQKYLSDKKTIIDIGAGPGIYASWLANRGSTVELVDVSERCLKLAAYRAEQSSLENKMSFRVGDAAELYFEEDESFDGALCLGPIYHAADVEDTQDMLREAYRILRPDGFYILNCANPFPWIKVVAASGEFKVAEESLDEIAQRGYCVLDGNGSEFGSFLCTSDAMKTFLIETGFYVINHFGSKGVFQNCDLSTINKFDQDALRQAQQLLIKTSTIFEYITQSEFLFFVAKKV
ncbi:MAG: class I SAM-dependent methyltransferase [Gammaproteobacteria bacterium]|nr:class I SAM-dependent methyltransferase [Gammaproteobacteria bacterium]